MQIALIDAGMADSAELLQPVCGQPLVAWSIVHAQQTAGIDAAIVSGDDALAGCAAQYGAELIEPGEPEAQLARLAERGATRVAVLDARAPLRRSELLAEMLAAIDETDADDDEEEVVAVQTVQREWMRDGIVAHPSLRVHAIGRSGDGLAAVALEQWELPLLDDLAELPVLQGLVAALFDRIASPPPPELAMLVFDFDGVMTEDGVWVDQDGRESVRCRRGDGLGLQRLQAAGYRCLVLSKEQNPVVAARCRKLGLEHVQGLDDKLPVLQRMAEEAGVPRERQRRQRSALPRLGRLSGRGRRRRAGLQGARALGHPARRRLRRRARRLRAGLGAASGRRIALWLRRATSMTSAVRTSSLPVGYLARVRRCRPMAWRYTDSVWSIQSSMPKRCRNRRRPSATSSPRSAGCSQTASIAAAIAAGRAATTSPASPTTSGNAPARLTIGA